MGWTGINTKQSFEDVFKSEFAHSIMKKDIVDYSFVNVPKNMMDDDTEEEAELFAAWRTNNGSVICATILWKRIDGEVLYKVMDETMGPCLMTKCPEKIKKMLSPLKDLEHQGYAENFRKDHLIPA